MLVQSERKPDTCALRSSLETEGGLCSSEGQMECAKRFALGRPDASPSTQHKESDEARKGSSADEDAHARFKRLEMLPHTEETYSYTCPRMTLHTLTRPQWTPAHPVTIAVILPFERRDARIHPGVNTAKGAEDGSVSYEIIAILIVNPECGHIEDKDEKDSGNLATERRPRIVRLYPKKRESSDNNATEADSARVPSGPLETRFRMRHVCRRFRRLPPVSYVREPFSYVRMPLKSRRHRTADSAATSSLALQTIPGEGARDRELGRMAFPAGGEGVSIMTPFHLLPQYLHDASFHGPHLTLESPVLGRCLGASRDGETCTLSAPMRTAPLPGTVLLDTLAITGTPRMALNTADSRKQRATFPLVNDGFDPALSHRPNEAPLPKSRDTIWSLLDNLAH
ncbi:hypothetical protein NMY22_g17677 [Coprinellus aureogranulatus]|nr:hypothetical protein NMY22_g17677 [Coprinellus aureogranulatus]